MLTRRIGQILLYTIEEGYENLRGREFSNSRPRVSRYIATRCLLPMR